MTDLAREVAERWWQFRPGNVPANKTSALEKFNRYHVPGTKTECWPWTGFCDRGGYGVLKVGDKRSRKTCRAHRWAYEHFIGPIPAGLQIDHACNNPSCVNPWHLKLATGRENTLRSNNPAAINSRKTHCPKGHPYSGSNLIVNLRPDGRPNRRCRICTNETARRSRAALAAVKGGGG